MRKLRHTMAKLYDVIVLGLGAMGSATLYQLSERKRNLANKLSILGIEQFISPHDKGSSHGETRITRESNFRDDIYVALAKRSNYIFREVASKTQGKFGNLYIPTGGLIIGSTKQVSNNNNSSASILAKIEASAIKHDLSHRTLSYEHLKQQFPQFNFTHDVRGYFEDNMGYLEPENCIAAQLYLANENGAEIAQRVTIINFKQLSSHCIELIDTNGNTYKTKKLIICAGPWIYNFLSKEYKQLFKIYRQTMHWFMVEEKSVTHYRPNKFPTFVWYLNDGNIFYGFPLVNQAQSIKIAAEQAIDYQVPYHEIMPEEVVRSVSKQEQQDLFERFIKPYLKGITSHCFRSTTCLYTVAPQWGFVIDYLPGYNQRVLIVSPCSGHGFKHSAAIGEALAEQAIENRSTIDIINAFKQFRTSI